MFSQLSRLKTSLGKIIIAIIKPLEQIAPAFSPTDHDPVAAFLFAGSGVGDGGQQVLQLGLGDLSGQTAGAGEHDEPVFDVGGARLVHEADAGQAVECGGLEDLREQRLAGFCFCLSVWRGEVVRERGRAMGKGERGGGGGVGGQ